MVETDKENRDAADIASIDDIKCKELEPRKDKLKTITQHRPNSGYKGITSGWNRSNRK